MTSVMWKLGDILDNEQSIERFHGAILHGNPRKGLAESLANVSQTEIVARRS